MSCRAIRLCSGQARRGISVGLLGTSIVYLGKTHLMGVSFQEAVEKVTATKEGHPERSRGISKMGQICDLEILSATGGPASGGRFAQNDRRSNFSTATQVLTPSWGGYSL